VLDTLLRYVHTLRYLRPQQLTGRVRNGLREAVTGTPFRSPGAAVENPVCTGLQPRTSFPERPHPNTQEALVSGQFRFLNHTRDLGWPPEWHPPASDLWRFELHYFQYLPLLDSSDQRALCRDWILANPVGTTPGWHPYPTSLRIVEWCRAGLDDETVLRSLYQQAAHLSRNLETHLLGNHLLENARALVCAGCYFDGDEPASWKARGLDLLRRQADEQILADGGHFERSPMYHALMLEVYADVLNLLSEGHPDEPFFTGVLAQMSDFLVSVTRPDGRRALFNDAVHEKAPSTAELCQYVEALTGRRPVPRQVLGSSGYFVLEGEESHLIVDAGPVGPDYLPAHAHADVFSYELSLGDVPFVVDTGVYEYQSGAMRNYVRCTCAHSTVTVDEVNQAECWHSFRVARRYEPHDVSVEQTDEGHVFQGTFDGYTHLIGDEIRHRRQMEVKENRRCIAVRDTVTGRGRHRVTSRLHLHPDVSLKTTEPNRAVGERDGWTAEISTSNSRIQVEKGWYCPEFGKKIRRLIICISRDRVLPTQITYRIRYRRSGP
jgi:uncharacterized heparinase superfamily protein